MIKFSVVRNFLTYEGDRPTNVMEAYAISVEKWKSLVLLFEDGHNVYGKGVLTCGFCMLYYRDNCSGCPISRKTGQRNCRGTPHEEFSNDLFLPEKLIVARKELQFLQYLKDELGEEGVE